ncbi:MAG: DNA mismatch repair endonuclease MutL [Acidobacteriota bacterium]|nr:MAG: DNA mismatch repair endonuclease MutL [Acidobacteriota bacterium]
MGRIHVLPPAVADRIAAGEVVERPASVVRELIDNSLDAGARRLQIELEEGGKAVVAVADDGHGMGVDDALLAFERHATSKISRSEELGAIVSLGFRGEALAAIAAVARVELVTCSGSGVAACRVVVDRGRLLRQEPASRAPGTSVIVRGLFDGVPARKKFLKSQQTEMDHCLRAVQRAALARPEVGFRLVHGDRALLVTAPSDNPRERVIDVLGSRWSRALVAAGAEAGAYRVAAWIGRADTFRPTRVGIHVFVNRRPVRDPLLLRAVCDGYRNFLPAGRFPVAVVYLELPPEELDVNVHPAKSEVRFERPQQVRSLIVGAIQRALAGLDAIPPFEAQRAVRGMVPTTDEATGPDAARALPPFRDAGARASAAGTGPPARVQVADAHAKAAPGASAAEALPFGDNAPRALAQYRDCFIVAADDRGLLVVDQHVAHERLLYEQLLRQADQGPLPRQALMFKDPVEADAAEMELIDRHRELLSRLGYKIELFGEQAFVVREAPQILGRAARPVVLSDILDRLRQGEAPRAETLFSELLATVACHTAVRKGMPLTPEKMTYILQGLRCCEAPSHCPHGRVISLRVELDALERAFDRR